MIADTEIKIATRDSKLATWQADHVASLLQKNSYKSKLIPIKTKGDIVLDRFLHEIGGKGLFIKELELNLLEGKSDIAVHSFKDMPVETPNPFQIGAVIKRHSPRDVMIFNPSIADKMGNLPKTITKEEVAKFDSITVGTASLRRENLIKSASNKITFKRIRGNVNTRISKLLNGEYDAIILAEAALERLNITNLIYRPFDINWFIPAPAQGAIAVEIPLNSLHKKAITSLNCERTEIHVTTERSLLKMLGGDCTMPIGCHISYCDQKQVTTGKAIILDYNGNYSYCEHKENFQLEKEDITNFAKAMLDKLLKDNLKIILSNIGVEI